MARVLQCILVMEQLMRQYKEEMQIRELMLLLAYQRWSIQLDKEIQAIEEIIK
jgi:hypothetical protein